MLILPPQIPNAGIGDKGAFEVVKFDEKGKPVKPRTITLDVNLTHVFLSESIHYQRIRRADNVPQLFISLSTTYLSGRRKEI